MRRGARALLPVAATALALAGCRDASDDAPRGRLLVVDSAGVALHLNLRTGPWGEAPRPVRETLRIGVVEGDDPYQLSRVTDVAVDPAGRILVANDQTATVRVFAPDGRFVREFGGRGEGPGEVLRIARLEPTGEDVAVVDFQRGGRVALFSPDGEPLRTVRISEPGRPWRPSPTHRTPQGWLAHASEFPSLRGRPAGTPDTLRRALHRMTPEWGLEPEPLVRLPPRVLYASPSVEGQGDWALFDARSETAVDAAGRIYVSWGRPYQVDVYAPDGTLLRRVRRAHDPVPLDPVEVGSHLELARAYFEGGGFPGPPGSGREAFERYRDRVRAQAAFPLPDHAAPTRRLRVAPDGSFWLERVDHRSPAALELEGTIPSAPPPEAASLWDVFDERGRLLGQAELPPRFRPTRAEGPARVIGVETDELDVEYVVRYEVTPS